MANQADQVCKKTVMGIRRVALSVSLADYLADHIPLATRPRFLAKTKVSALAPKV